MSEQKTLKEVIQEAAGIFADTGEWPKIELKNEFTLSIDFITPDVVRFDSKRNLNIDETFEYESRVGLSNLWQIHTEPEEKAPAFFRRTRELIEEIGYDRFIEIAGTINGPKEPKEAFFWWLQDQEGAPFRFSKDTYTEDGSKGIKAGNYRCEKAIFNPKTGGFIPPKEFQ